MPAIVYANVATRTNKKKTKIIRFINCSDFASDKNDSSFAINKSNSAIK